MLAVAIRTLLLMALIGCDDKPRRAGPAAPPADAALDTELEAAATLHVRGEHAAAVTALKRYLEGHPRHVLAWVIRGHAHEELDQDAEARVAYDEALRLDPRSHQALTGLGILARKRNAYDEALDAYRRALAIEPGYAEAYSSMAIIALARGDDANAVVWAERAWQLDGEHPRLAANLAVAYHYVGRLAERDAMVGHAERLGYPRVAVLHQIFRGELSMRDDAPAPDQRTQ
jgi:Flp pilus assembly protein TadD